MDEEDMATNTNLLATSRGFDSLNKNARNKANALKSTKSNVAEHFGDKMSEYLVVDHDAISDDNQHSKGIELLLKCGWRMGQNIGSQSTMKRLKLLLNRSKAESKDLLFGNDIMGTTDHSEDPLDDERVIPIYRPRKKTNVHGIGFDEQFGDQSGARNDGKSAMTALTTLERDIESERGRRGQKRSHSEAHCDGTFGSFISDLSAPKKRKLMGSMTTSSAARHGLSALEEVEIGDDIYGDDEMGTHRGYNRFIGNSDDDDDDGESVLMKDNDRKSIRDRNVRDRVRSSSKNRSEKTQRHKSRDGTLPIDGFVISSSIDDSEYSIKNTLRSCNEQRRRRSRFDCDVDGVHRFKSDQMQIHHDFLRKFGDIDLSVGSFLLRAQSNLDIKNRRNRIFNESTMPHHVTDAQRRDNRQNEEIGDRNKRNLKKMESRSETSKSRESSRSNHLSSNFVAADVLVSGETLGGLSAGLTLSTQLPGVQQQQRKANEILKEIRDQFGGENADKLLRFDIYLADKLRIESPIENAADFMMDDGSKTQFELKREQFQFEAKWNDLKPYQQHLYPNKSRIHGKRRDDGDNVKDVNSVKSLKNQKDQSQTAQSTSTTSTAQEAAKRGLYGALTRSEEMWIPDRLLCKRCNIRDPFQGMYSGNAQNVRNTQSQSSRFGGTLLEKAKEHGMKSMNRMTTNTPNVRNVSKTKNTENMIEDQSKGELVAAMLGEDESNMAPPMLQLKQLKTWNSYLQQTDSPKANAARNQVDAKEMKSFLDGVMGVLHDSDNDPDDKGKKEKSGPEGDVVDMTLFKSIFDDHSSSESESESDNDSQNDSENVNSTKVDEIEKIESGPAEPQKVPKTEEPKMITVTMPPIEMEEPPKDQDRDKERDHVDDRNIDDIEIPRARKRFKFIAKSERQKSSVIPSNVGSIGVINDRRSASKPSTNLLETVVAADTKKAKLAFGSDSDDDKEGTVATVQKGLVWAVVDSGCSSEDDQDIMVNDKGGSSRKDRKSKREVATFRKRSKRSDRKKRKKHSSRR